MMFTSLLFFSLYNWLNVSCLLIELLIDVLIQQRHTPPSPSSISHTPLVMNSDNVDTGEENKGTEDDCELSEPHRESQLSDPSPSSETVLHSSIMLIIFWYLTLKNKCLCRTGDSFEKLIIRSSHKWFFCFKSHVIINVFSSFYIYRILSFI